jgi:hypothetical protein
VSFRTIFRDKLERNIFVVAREEQTFQREVVGSNQSPVTNSDEVEHLMGGASYGQRRIAQFGSQLDPLVDSFDLKVRHRRKGLTLLSSITSGHSLEAEPILAAHFQQTVRV